MKNYTSYLSVVLSLAISSCVFAAPPSDAWFKAIATVESSNNPAAIGDGGKAIGLYQIHKCYWQDAVQHDPSIGGRYEDCYDPDYARRIVIAYLDRYAPKNATNEQLSRIHNGGPRGNKIAATKKYWVKVQKHLQ